MSEVKKPSEKFLQNPYDGVEIEDTLGRKIRLKKPALLDKYDLLSAMGDDAKNIMCVQYAIPLLHIATIDGMVMEPPKTARELRFSLSKIGEEAVDAVVKFMNEIVDEREKTDESYGEKIKK